MLSGWPLKTYAERLYSRSHTISHCNQVASHLSFPTSIRIRQICMDWVVGTNCDLDFTVWISLGRTGLAFPPRLAPSIFIRRCGSKISRCKVTVELWFDSPQHWSLSKKLGRARVGPPLITGPSTTTGPTTHHRGTLRRNQLK
jgi:hypothetical protein